MTKNNVYYLYQEEEKSARRLISSFAMRHGGSRRSSLGRHGGSRRSSLGRHGGSRRSSLGSTSSAGQSTRNPEKKKILCLHGWYSNPSITIQQLENLGLCNEDEDDVYEFDHLVGPKTLTSNTTDMKKSNNQGAKTESDVENPLADPNSTSNSDIPGGLQQLQRNVVEILSNGPYFAWFDHMDSINNNRNDETLVDDWHDNMDSSSNMNDETLVDDLKAVLKMVLKHVITHGPYHGVYGFSQGATIATLLSCQALRNVLLNEMAVEKSSLNNDPTINFPWNFMISVCGAGLSEEIKSELEWMITVYLKNAEDDVSISALDTSTLEKGATTNNKGLIVNGGLRCVNIIGLEDPYKIQTDFLHSLYHPTLPVLTMYMESMGHDVPHSLTRLPYNLSNEIFSWCYGETNERTTEIAELNLPKITNKVNKNPPTTDTVMVDNDIQLLYNRNQTSAGNHGQAGTLMDLLKEGNQTSVCLRDGDDPRQPSITYGELVSFLREGQGNLRASIRVKPGDTVVYLAPYGILSAIAFLTVATQCTAAPLDPESCNNMAELELAMEQIKPDYMLVFLESGDNIEFTESDISNMKATAKKFGIPLSFAKRVEGTCGLFSFETIADYQSNLSMVENSIDDTCLMLQTSGTTSKPKVVPLIMGSVVANAISIAKSLGLRNDDIALNAMPLFHIGGIASNLLSSIAAGASVTCLGKFNPVDFLEKLTSTDAAAPTWYSAVPTIHAVIQQMADEADTKMQHSLRFIRTGAAAMPQDLTLKLEATFGCPVVPTYSMTEQMPITQPPCGFHISMQKPGSVGKAVCTSMCIVDKCLRPVAYADNDEEPIKGEVCISGPTIMKEYLANEKANSTAFFWIGNMVWFRTGDIGYIDRDGFLFLSGRSKEVIKRGGNQVSPFEVEEAIVKHPAITNAVVFPIPDPIWGQRVGAALVLSPQAESDKNIRRNTLTLKNSLYDFLTSLDFPRSKYPEDIYVVAESDIPKTKSNKYIRNGLFEALMMESNNKETEIIKPLVQSRPVVIHEAAVGVKFILAVAVMYVHIGRIENWSLENPNDFLMENMVQKPFGFMQTRTWCFHTPLFFFVGGFFLAAGCHAPVTNVKDLLNFYTLRIASLHPMYLVSILWCVLQFLARCRPSNFSDEFERVRDPNEGDRFLCQATPVEMTWGWTFFITVLNYTLGLQSWPFMIPFSWFMSAYTWFSSVYIFCIFVFPWLHRHLFQAKDDKKRLLKITLGWVIVNYYYMGLFALGFCFVDNVDAFNWFGLSAYLFPPGWVPSFSLGICCYFLFRAYRPNESIHAWKWGVVTDVLSLLLLAGWLFYGLDPYGSAPPVAKISFLSLRVWAAMMSRLLCPFGFLWFWGTATGTGLTSYLLSGKFIVRWLAPASYNIFLFHQPISELYTLATRGFWWAQPRAYYWFSSIPYPCATWEIPILYGIIIAISVFLDVFINERLVILSASLLKYICCFSDRGKDRQNENAKQATKDVAEVVCDTISDLTYSNNINLETDFGSIGLGSLNAVMLVGEIKKIYKTCRLTSRDLLDCDTVSDLVSLIETRMKNARLHGEHDLVEVAG